jgi:hypothetical protein
MTKEQLISQLDYWCYSLDRINHMDYETGYGSNPISYKQIAERYKLECDYIKSSMKNVKEELKRRSLYD